MKEKQSWQEVSKKAPRQVQEQDGERAQKPPLLLVAHVIP